MLEAQEVKKIFLDLGADLCGIAASERFNDAPDGFHPRDVFDSCESVVVFAKRMPAGCLFASSAVPYTKLNKVSHDMLDAIGYSASLELEESGFRTVAVPADDPSEYWEAERQYARGIISLRHAGYLAGLGVLGRNTLLKNGRYGNMILLGAVLLDAPLEADPVDASDPCPPDCRICLDACPQEALDGETVIQQKCRPLSNHITVRGMQLYKCWECRKACPDALGKG